MTDLVIWFGIWDDVIEKLIDPTAAESLRVSTKDFIRNALSPKQGRSTIATANPLIQSFQPIADEACAFYNEGMFHTP